MPTYRVVYVEYAEEEIVARDHKHVIDWFYKHHPDSVEITEIRELQPDMNPQGDFSGASENEDYGGR